MSKPTRTRLGERLEIARRVLDFIRAFFDEHVKRDRWGNITNTYFRDVHRDPIFFAGYSIRVAEGGYLPRYRWNEACRPERDTKRRVRVRIARDTYQTLKADYVARAKSGRWSVRALEAAIFNLPFLPYAPVREQLWRLVRWMNDTRKERGFGDRLDPTRCIRRKIPAISAFDYPMALERKNAVCLDSGRRIRGVTDRRGGMPSRAGPSESGGRSACSEPLWCRFAPIARQSLCCGGAFRSDVFENTPSRRSSDPPQNRCTE